MSDPTAQPALEQSYKHFHLQPLLSRVRREINKYCHPHHHPLAESLTWVAGGEGGRERKIFPGPPAGTDSVPHALGRPLTSTFFTSCIFFLTRKI